MTNFLLDKEIFCDQVIRNQETMFRTAKAILHQDEDAEDAVQEAICAAYAGRGSLRDPARFRPWILKILVNKCYEFCRKRRTTVDLADIQDFLPAPAADQAERLSLWQAVMALNSDLRAVVTLFYYEDLSIREISARSGHQRGGGEDPSLPRAVPAKTTITRGMRCARWSHSTSD